MKVSELTGGLLDFWVGKAEHREPLIAHYKDHSRAFIHSYSNCGEESVHVYSPSSKWGQGGYLIQKYGINVNTDRLHNQDQWIAYIVEEDVIEGEPVVIMCHMQKGDTALEAAMRCYVDLKLGEKFDGEDVE